MAINVWNPKKYSLAMPHLSKSFKKLWSRFVVKVFFIYMLTPIDAYLFAIKNFNVVLISGFVVKLRRLSPSRHEHYMSCTVVHGAAS